MATSFAAALAMLAACASHAVAAARFPKPPHILFIVADDLGWDDVGFRSHQIRTPNIDRLAAEGVLLDNYYVQSVCSPSRATFMTGRYPLHHTVNDWLRPGLATGLPLNETLVPELLAEAGYRRHATGKWHLGFTYWEHTPTFRGFESFVGFYSGGEGYFSHLAANGGYDFRRDMQAHCGANCSRLVKEDKGRYSTFVFTERAVQVIHEHDVMQPLFLYLAYQAVHSPQQVPEAYSDAYTDTIHDRERRGFAGMLSCMDEGIGNVTAALRRRDMLNDTLIVFTTDNGGPSSHEAGGDAIGSRNFPLRGGKHSIWEGGTRGTALVWAGAATGLLPAERRGSTAAALLHAADWLPTLCGIAGVAACERLPLDGFDQGSALFRGARGRRREVLYGRHDDAPERFKPYDTALRDAAGWKLIQGWGGAPAGWSQPANRSSASASTTEAWTDAPGTACCAEAAASHDVGVEGCCGTNCLRALGCDGYDFQAGAGECVLRGDLTKCSRRPVRSEAGAPTPGSPGTVMLFNVHEDPTERSELSVQHPEVVRRLSARLDALRREQVDVVGGGGHPDPACPSYNMSEHIDSDVGHFWEPWCVLSQHAEVVVV